MTKGFQFKQFFVRHDRCAMKVGTDSIMLGSWVMPGHAKTVLDIGTGSGLLALMLAQKCLPAASISGIDIDPHAIEQARDNAQVSPWARQLVFDCIALQDFRPDCPLELIVSNPPYYPAGQRFDKAREQARHTGMLSHAALLGWVSGHLAENGRFACVLPVSTALPLMDKAAGYALSLSRRLDVSTTASKPVSRVLMEFIRTKNQASTPQEEQLTIYAQGPQYSQAYRQLCRDYYLNF
ncbi:tRNA1(Val) (adenine(37)-N6)-methyltransferase [Bowmanella dokdonensis]|uniref:tRNA1(Val) (adenine(37)-N6)-methyltransferase n=1 Tax=Bowmanella dokdonensis TaxID=751969 RepID=A0A939IRE6_9ALTE|nr:50S ribosomal protein L11 methyltransferase [Bowmanella dokdonensis]MBN7825572.1 methyltransferase [Bowmanella dokdonensis]